MGRNLAWAAVAAALVASPLSAQDAAVQAGLRVDRLVAEPSRVTFEAGRTARITITALDASGEPVAADIRVFGRGVSFENGVLSADLGGEGMPMATVVLPPNADREPPTLTVPVTVTWPPVTLTAAFDGARGSVAIQVPALSATRIEVVS